MLMVFRRSSASRLPPLASGWWRLARLTLYLDLTASSVVGQVSPQRAVAVPADHLAFHAPDEGAASPLPRTIRRPTKCAADRASPPPPTPLGRGDQAARTDAATRYRSEVPAPFPPATCLCNSPTCCCRRAHAPGRTTSTHAECDGIWARGIRRARRNRACRSTAPVRPGRARKPGLGQVGATWGDYDRRNGGLAMAKPTG